MPASSMNPSALKDLPLDVRVEGATNDLLHAWATITAMWSLDAREALIAMELSEGRAQRECRARECAKIAMTAAESDGSANDD